MMKIKNLNKNYLSLLISIYLFFLSGCGESLPILDPIEPTSSTALPDATPVPTGAANLALSPLTYDFGSITVGVTSGSQIFTITNNGGSTATGCSNPQVTGAHSGDFQIGTDNCRNFDLSAGASCTFEVEALPSVAGLRTATITRNCTSGGSVSTTANGVTVTGLGPVLAIDLSTFNFGSIPLGSLSNNQVFTFSNSGGADAQGCSAPALSGTNSTEFMILNDNCGTNDLTSGGGSCTVAVGMIPTTLGVRSATLSRTCIIGGTISTTANGVTGTGVAQIIYQWAWQSGDDDRNASGIYAAPPYHPGSRRGASSWQIGDTFYLFGGQGYDGIGSLGSLNDLWSFNTTSSWSYVSGSNLVNQNGDYTAPGAVPGARYGSTTWADSNGVLWLFGGFGFDDGTFGDGYMNDLWSYSTGSATWNHVKGSSNINQIGDATFGVSATPGARVYASSWVDGTTLYLYGGYGYDCVGNLGYLNDLWSFDGTNWNYIKGSTSSVDQGGIYGTQGTASASNNPGGRDSAATWIDQSGQLWLFGGNGYATSTVSAGRMNDLWRYDGSDWTWVKGSDAIGQLGDYGSEGYATTSNVPGARSGAFAWKDSNHDFWLFGGYGNDASSVGYLNDVWKFDGYFWSHMAGSATVDEVGVYGTLGVPSSANDPGGRNYPVGWIDSTDHFWLFGGYGYDQDSVTPTLGYLNDLWKLDY